MIVFRTPGSQTHIFFSFLLSIPVPRTVAAVSDLPVRNCEGSDVLPYWQADKWAWLSSWLTTTAAAEVSRAPFPTRSHKEGYGCPRGSRAALQERNPELKEPGYFNILSWAVSMLLLRPRERHLSPSSKVVSYANTLSLEQWQLAPLLLRNAEMWQTCCLATVLSRLYIYSSTIHPWKWKFSQLLFFFFQPSWCLYFIF